MFYLIPQTHIMKVKGKPLDNYIISSVGFFTKVNKGLRGQSSRIVLSTQSAVSPRAAFAFLSGYSTAIMPQQPYANLGGYRKGFTVTYD